MGGAAARGAKGVGAKAPAASPARAPAAAGPMAGLHALHGLIGNRAVGQLLTGGGAPLDPSVRAAMEARFGTSLGAVRVHAGEAAGAAARSLRAKAFTVGNHVAFGRGRYAPGTPAGDQLLGHELTHVVQQGAGSSPLPAAALANPAPHPAGSPAEREAAGFDAAGGGRVSHWVPPGALMLAPDGEKGYLDRAADAISGAASASWEAIKGGLLGDFKDDPDLADIAVGTGIGLIPVVGEITAGRDVIANAYFMAERNEIASTARWFSLSLALLSLFPEIGAAIKGFGKTILKGAVKELAPMLRALEALKPGLGNVSHLLDLLRGHWAQAVEAGMGLWAKARTRLTQVVGHAAGYFDDAKRVWVALEKIFVEAEQRIPKTLNELFEKLTHGLQELGAQLGGPQFAMAGVGRGERGAASTVLMAEARGEKGLAAGATKTEAAEAKQASHATRPAEPTPEHTAPIKANSFSITDWTGYPAGVPKPAGPFRLLEGAEYEAARKQADSANKALHQAHPEKYAGKDIHEIHPVKYGGSPTDPANKIALTRKEHSPLTVFWNRLMNNIKPK